MKNIKTLSIFIIATVLFSCQPAAKKENQVDLTSYNLNLITAQKFLAAFSSEDIESQKPLLCPGVTYHSPFYGSEPTKTEGILSTNKAWMDNFDDITYSDAKWFPGTDELGKPDGSVMTTGNWTAKSIATGNVVTVNAFHSYVFNAKNQIHEAKDFFDASGVMAAAMKTE